MAALYPAESVVGTIAGDDTVLVATPDAPTADRVARRLAAPLAVARRRRRVSA